MSTHNFLTAESGNYFGKNTWSWRSFAEYDIKQNRYNSDAGEYHGLMKYDLTDIKSLNNTYKATNIQITMTRAAAGGTTDTKTGLGLAVGTGVYGSVVPAIPETTYKGQSLTKADISLSGTSGIGTTTTFSITGAQAEAWIDYLCAGDNKCLIFSRRLIDSTYSSYAAISKCTMEITWESRGSVYAKIGGAWRHGRPYVKISGTWRSGTIYTKINGVWRKGI